MSDRKTRLRRGQRVHIALVEEEQAGWATFVRRERETGSAFSTPVFRFGRKLVRGYECWWVTAKEYKSAMEKYDAR